MQSSSNPYIHTCSTNNQPDPSRAFSFDQIFHEIESHPSRSNTRQPALRFDEIISLTAKERRKKKKKKKVASQCKQLSGNGSLRTSGQDKHAPRPSTNLPTHPFTIAIRDSSPDPCLSITRNRA